MVKDSDFFSDLKLRRVGITGNQDVGSWYPTVAVYNTVNSSLTNYVLYPNGANTGSCFIATMNPERYNKSFKLGKNYSI